MGFILYVISYLLNFILTPFVTLYTLCRKRNTDYYFKQIAVATDKKGNITCQYLFNDVLIKKNGYKFGQDSNDTISYVLGMNQINNTLTWMGKRIIHILHLLKDPQINSNQ